MLKIKTWKQLNNIEQIEEISRNSFEKPQIIFKHSVSCGISLHALHKLESEWDFSADLFDFYYLDLLANRAISNQIAIDFCTIHQSPQIIIIKNGETITSFSHQSISVKKISDFIR